MSEERPGAITGEELVAYIDGDAPGLAGRLAGDPVSAATAAEYDRVQRGLRRALWRFDCPAPHDLGEYELGFGGPDERAGIAAHLRACPRCADELRQLRGFLALDDAPPAPRPGERLRRLVATLLPGPGAAPAFALRGVADPTTQTYEAGGLTITVDLAPGPRGDADLTGLLVHEDEEGDTSGAVVALAAADGAARTTTADELGNFAFERVAPGDYRLEVQLGDAIVTIDDLHIGA